MERERLLCRLILRVRSRDRDLLAFLDLSRELDLREFFLLRLFDLLRSFLPRLPLLLRDFLPFAERSFDLKNVIFI